jgi:hypothetical protein
MAIDRNRFSVIANMSIMIYMKIVPTRGNMIRFILSALFIFQCATLFADDWKTYLSQALLEQKKFAGWCPEKKAQNIMNLIHAENAQICVEIGVYGGSSFYPITAALAFNQQGIAYAIDPWSNEACIEGYEEDDKVHKYWSKVDLSKTLYGFLEKMHNNNMDAHYAVMRMTSAQACPFFEDNSINFLHIDGNHSEESAIYDVENWLPKVKSGGIICFDDAWWESTKKAIKLLMAEADIMPESNPEWKHIFLRKR